LPINNLETYEELSVDWGGGGVSRLLATLMSHSSSCDVVQTRLTGVPC